MRRLFGFAALSLCLAGPGAALAHTPYLAPSTFAPSRDFVTVQAALAETDFFIPEFPIRGEGDYLAIGPDGAATKITTVTLLKEYAAVEVALPAQGTYRITTGDRPGRSGKMAKVDGVWRGVRPAGGPPPRPPREGEAPRPNGPISETDLPPGTEVIVTQGFLKSETYVSRGSPSKGALKPTGQGFELAPETHPNEIFAGEAFKFALLNDGKPAPEAAFIVAKAGDAYADKKFSYAGKTGADGKAAVTFAEPGIYVLQASYPGRVEGGAPAARTTSYTMTFEVTR